MNYENRGIGDRLLEERRRLNLNQTDMGKLGGVALNTYYSYEKGTRTPDAGCLANLYAAGVDVLYIVTGTRNNSALNNAETLLLELFNRVDERTRHVFLTMLREYDSYGK